MIELRNVWKVFGSLDKPSLEALARGELTKAEALEKFGCVIGVAAASFQVSRGEIFCLMGLSGSGKSTLVRHINRLIEPTIGSIVVDGTDVNSLSKIELRELRATKIGMVFQNVALLPHRTVRDNVAFPFELRGMPRAKRQEIASRVLHTVQLDGWGDRYPSELSGGMQQRVGLARALASDPDVLLMDEPFSALDPLIRRQLQDEFLSLSKDMKKTTVFITHDLEEAAKLGDRIAIIRDGVIVQIDTPEGLIRNPADPYVSQFVAGISQLNLLRADAIMEPLNGFCDGVGDGPRADVNDSIEQLITLIVNNDKPITVFFNDQPVGFITKDRLLLTVQAGAGHA